jgi:hypothetical protein
MGYVDWVPDEYSGNESRSLGIEMFRYKGVPYKIIGCNSLPGIYEGIVEIDEFLTQEDMGDIGTQYIEGMLDPEFDTDFTTVDYIGKINYYGWVKFHYQCDSDEYYHLPLIDFLLRTVSLY